jgi:putative nucleotidyltransferase with HDIG domain
VDTEEQLLEGFLEDLHQNRLVLPTLPEVALKVRDAVESDKASAADIAKIISMDVALSARILQICNSPLYRTRRAVEDIQTAVARLGNIQVRNLVSSLVMQQMFQATSDVLDKKMRAAWEHSTQVASICYVLASAAGIPKDQAMLAGLIHDIGALPIIVHAEDIPELREDEALLDKVIQKLHTMIGAKILKDWQFPQSLIDVAAQHENLQRDPETKIDYVDVVIAANLQSYIGSKHPYNDLDWNTIPAFQRLGLEPEINILDIEENQEDLQAVKSMLSY